MGSPRCSATAPTASAPSNATVPHPKIARVLFIPVNPVEHCAETWSAAQPSVFFSAFVSSRFFFRRRSLEHNRKMAYAFLNERWLPKSVLCLRDYNANKFLHDLIAGITVGLVALPLAMAFAIASGLTPQAGIYCAIVTGFLISLLGGSKTQIGGPTGAFVVVISGIVALHGVDGLFMCTVMAGILLMIMGIAGMGTAVKFIPRPVVIGFTNGIAILIASTQVKDFFGLQLAKVPGVFWLRMEALSGNFHTLSYAATGLAAGTVATIILCRTLSNRIPGAIVAFLLGAAAVVLFKLPVETIGSRFGGIPPGLSHSLLPRVLPP